MTAAKTAKRRNKALGLYTKTDLARELRITRQGLVYNIKTGIVPQPTRGEGERKYYSAEDVRKIRDLWNGK